MDCRWRRIQLAITGRVAPSSCITSTTSHPPHWHSRRHLAANGEEWDNRRMAKRACCRPRCPMPAVETASLPRGDSIALRGKRRGGLPSSRCMLANQQRHGGRGTGEPTAFRRTVPLFRCLECCVGGLRQAGWASTTPTPGGCPVRTWSFPVGTLAVAPVVCQSQAAFRLGQGYVPLSASGQMPLSKYVAKR